jgi:hypothetical protein
MSNGAVVKVFPQFRILLQIDNHGRFLAVLIHHELHAFHDFFPQLLIEFVAMLRRDDNVSRLSEKANLRLF